MKYFFFTIPDALICKTSMEWSYRSHLAKRTTFIDHKSRKYKLKVDVEGPLKQGSLLTLKKINAKEQPDTCNKM